jgi:hypothetical protein
MGLKNLKSMINILAKANTNHKSIGMGLNPFLLKTTHTKGLKTIWLYDAVR